MGGIIMRTEHKDPKGNPSTTTLSTTSPHASASYLVVCGLS